MNSFLAVILGAVTVYLAYTRVVVNMLIDRQALAENTPDFVLNRIQMQEEHMRTIWDKFDGSVRAVVSLFDQEVRGIKMLRAAGKALFGEPARGL